MKTGESLGSDHWPYHLLCKSHTIEKLDATNLKVLATIEKSVKQRQLFELINPSLKSFFQGKKTVVEAGMGALMTLVSHDKSGKSFSQAELFDLTCVRVSRNTCSFINKGDSPSWANLQQH